MRVGMFSQKPCTAKVNFEHLVPLGDGQITDASWACYAGMGWAAFSMESFSTKFCNGTTC